MRAMKDSGIEWIGSIPVEWDIAVLKRLGSPVTGSTPAKENADYWNGDIPWVSSKDMKTDYLQDSEDHITQKAVEERGLTLFNPGTLIFCVRSGILRHTFPVAVSTCPATINQDLRALCLPDDVNPSFLLYYMRGMNDIIVTLYQKIGATVESIEMDWFLYFPVVLPSLDEQCAIAKALDSKCAEIDALIAAKEKTNALLKERRQSIIYEAVTKGLDPTVPMKDSGVEWIGDIPETWEALRLKYCLEGIDSGTSVNSEDRPASAGEYGVLKTSCVYSGSFDPDENKTVLDSEYGRVSCPVRANTLIVSRMNTADLIGACGYVENDYPNLFLPDRLWRLTFHDNCLPKYMWYFLSSKYAKNYYASLCTGTSGSMQNISQEQLSSIVFVKPPFEEQKAIVDKLGSQLTALDAIIVHNERTVKKLKEYHHSIVFEAVTGKTEIH